MWRTVILGMVVLLLLNIFPPTTAQQIDEGVVVFYIKVIIFSSSDWTSVTLFGEEKLVNVRYRLIEGDAPVDVVWEGKWFGISRCCYPERVINATVEFQLLITNLDPAGVIRMQVQKGDVGTTIIRIYDREGRMIKQITHSGVVPGSGGRNPLNFTIDSAGVASSGMVTILGKSGYDKMVWAAYYPWYLRESWRDSKMADRPLIGEYASDDENVIRLHIRMAKAAGIDGFAVSWWGPNTFTDKNLMKILKIAAEEDFHVAAYLESLGGRGEPRPLTELENMLEYLLIFYGGRSAYYKLDGRPVVFVWAAGSHEPEEWGTIFENLKEKGIGAIFIATVLNTDYLFYFDGLQNYAGDELDKITQVYGKVGPAVKTYHILYGGREKIWMPSVWPGYDERLLPDRMGLFFDREEGQYYLGFYAAARASYPDWLWITSFNEWWENTHIEPSRRYGYRYLFLTDYIVANFKNKPINPDKLLSLVIDLEKPFRTITKLAVSTITVTQRLDTTRIIHSVETRTVEMLRTVTSVSTLLTEKRTVEIADIILVTAPLLLVATLSTAYAIRTRRKHASLHRRDTKTK